MRKNKSRENNENGINNETLCAEYGAVYRFVLSLTHDEHEAEDITQETFLRALDAKEQFSGGSSLYTWLCTIAKNQLLNRLKKQKRSAGSDPLAGQTVNIESFPVNEGDKLLRINGKDICEIGEIESTSELPGYIRAYHEMSVTDHHTYLRIDDEEYDPETNKTVYKMILGKNHTGKHITWDVDGNVLEDTTDGDTDFVY